MLLQFLQFIQEPYLIFRPDAILDGLEDVGKVTRKYFNKLGVLVKDGVLTQLTAPPRKAISQFDQTNTPAFNIFKPWEIINHYVGVESK